MKSKGENRRFMDETGYLLDGIEDENATKGFRRARYVVVPVLADCQLCGYTQQYAKRGVDVKAESLRADRAGMECFSGCPWRW
jgi:hypothetical protein